MKAIKLLPILTASLLVVLMTSCGPAYVNTGGYGPGYYGARPYYGYGYGYGYGGYGGGYYQQETKKHSWFSKLIGKK